MESPDFFAQNIFFGGFDGVSCGSCNSPKPWHEGKNQDTTENGVSTDKDEGTTEQQTTRHQNHLEDPRKCGVVEGDLRPADSSNSTGGS